MLAEFQEKFKEAQKQGNNIGACIRLKYKDTFLILRRSQTDKGAGIYEMPGGTVDEGENLEEAATRELLEETGIKISKDDLIPLGIFEFKNVETGKQKTKFAYSVSLEEKPEIILSEDHDDYLFLTKEEIEKLPRQGIDKDYLIWSDHCQILLM